jgi:NADH-quinone oxidoreductase subunit J
MEIKSALFYLFSAVLLFAALRVITSRNPVHAALYLVLAFFQASGIWMLLKAEFLSITLVLVYVGAVMVLFLFVVMMIDINLDALKKDFWKHFPLAAFIGAVLALEVASVLMGGFRSSQIAVDSAVSGAPVSNTRDLGVLLYTEYLYPLEIAAVILLVAIVSAIALTMRERKDTKAQDPGEQVKVKAADRLGTACCRGTQIMNITLGHYLTLGAVLFSLSVIGIFLNRKNLIVLLMAIELMLLAVNTNFVAFSHYLGDMHGQVFVFFILTVAAAESAIGLAILVLLFRNRSSVNVDELNSLKG